MRPIIRARLVTLCALGIPLIAGVCLHQYRRYVFAHEDAMRAMAAAEERITRICAARVQRSELDDEIRLIDADLYKLREILPDVLDAESFLVEVRQRAERFYVAVVENDSRIDSAAKPAPRMDVSLLLKGKAKDLASFVQAVPHWARIIDYKEIERGDGWVLANLSTRGAPPWEREKAEDCSITRTIAAGVFLPPFRAWLDRDRAKLEELETQLAREAETVTAVNRFEERRSRLQALVDLISYFKEKEIEPSQEQSPP